MTYVEEPGASAVSVVRKAVGSHAQASLSLALTDSGTDYSPDMSPEVSPLDSTGQYSPWSQFYISPSGYTPPASTALNKLALSPDYHLNPFRYLRDCEGDTSRCAGVGVGSSASDDASASATRCSLHLPCPEWSLTSPSAAPMTSASPLEPSLTDASARLWANVCHDHDHDRDQDLDLDQDQDVAADGIDDDGGVNNDGDCLYANVFHNTESCEIDGSVHTAPVFVPTAPPHASTYAAATSATATATAASDTDPKVRIHSSESNGIGEKRGEKEGQSEDVCGDEHLCTTTMTSLAADAFARKDFALASTLYRALYDAFRVALVDCTSEALASGPCAEEGTGTSSDRGVDTQEQLAAIMYPLCISLMQEGQRDCCFCLLQEGLSMTNSHATGGGPGAGPASPGTGLVNQAKMARIRGKLLVAVGDVDAAETEFRACLEMFSKRYGFASKHLEVYIATTDLMNLYLTEGRVQDAKVIIPTVWGAPETAAVHRRFAQAHRLADDFKAAEAELSKCFFLFEKSLVASSHTPMLAEVLMEIADMRERQGKDTTTTLALLVRALKILMRSRSLSVSGSPVTAAPSSLLSSLPSSSSSSIEVEEEKVTGAFGTMVAEGSLSQHRCWSPSAAADKAGALAHPSFRRRRSQSVSRLEGRPTGSSGSNPDVPVTSLLVDCLSRIGRIFLSMGQRDKAVYFENKALCVLAEEPHADPTVVANSHANLAVVYAEQRDYDRAEALLVQALAVLGGGHDGEGSAVCGCRRAGDASQKIRWQLQRVRRQKRGIDGEAVADACGDVCPNPLISNPCPQVPEVCQEVCQVCTIS